MGGYELFFLSSRQFTCKFFSFSGSNDQSQKLLKGTVVPICNTQTANKNPQNPHKKPPSKKNKTTPKQNKHKFNPPIKQQQQQQKNRQKTHTPKHPNKQHTHTNNNTYCNTNPVHSLQPCFLCCYSPLMWCYSPLLWCYSPLLWCYSPLLWCYSPLLWCYSPLPVVIWHLDIGVIYLLLIDSRIAKKESLMNYLEISECLIPN